MSWLHWALTWQFDPSVWLGCALALLVYPRLPGARRDRRALLWVLGVLVVLVSLESAIDVIGDSYLFSMHMAQHLLLSMVGPPLMIAGIPSAAVDALLRARVGNFVRVLVSPYFAGPAYFAVLVVWHWPPFFDYAISHPLVHILQHLSFLAVGFLFWWAVLVHRPQERWNLTGLGEVAYLTVGALPAVVVGLTLALLPTPVYGFYLHRSINLGMGALADQRLGGLLMFVFDNALMAAMAGWYLWRMFPADGSDEARLRVEP
ncbi:MAG: cytochrome c oxidase assembly protein [Candidatus Dormiibacterota bacterium]